MDPLIITCAITGAEVQKTQQPHLPITANEQALAAAEVLKAGASIIHLHVRDKNGAPTQDLECFRQASESIRQAAQGILLQYTTGGAIGDSIEDRIKPLSLEPEMASLNMGSMNFGNDVFLNSPADIQTIAKEIKAHNILPELEVYDLGMIEAAAKMLKQKMIPEKFRIQFVLGVPGGASGDIDSLCFLLNRAKNLLGSHISWSVAGIGRFQLPVATHAILMGGHVRVGFEDNIYYKKGVLADSNAQLVARINRLATELDREIATPQQTRQIMGLA